MEKWDVLDAQGVTVGRTVVRGQTALKSGEYHLVVHIWVVSDNGRFLIQRRSDKKRLMPGEWAAIGGSAILGETSFCAAQRELLEEMGIRLVERRSKLVNRIKKRNSFIDVWLTNSNVPLSQLTLRPSEVAAAKWVSKDELVDMLQSGQFHQYGKEYFDTLFGCVKDFMYELECKR